MIRETRSFDIAVPATGCRSRPRPTGSRVASARRQRIAAACGQSRGSGSNPPSAAVGRHLVEPEYARGYSTELILPPCSEAPPPVARLAASAQVLISFVRDVRASASVPPPRQYHRDRQQRGNCPAPGEQPRRQSSCQSIAHGRQRGDGRTRPRQMAHGHLTPAASASISTVIGPEQAVIARSSRRSRARHRQPQDSPRRPIGRSISAPPAGICRIG